MGGIDKIMVDKIMGARRTAGWGSLTTDYADFRGWERGINTADPPSRSATAGGDATNAEKNQAQVGRGFKSRLTANLR
jgi:hypothetical protein